MTIKQKLLLWCAIALPLFLAGPLLMEHPTLFWNWGIITIVYIGLGFNILGKFNDKY